MRKETSWPERIYIIETDGTIAYKGGMGPFYFKPEDIEEYLKERYPLEITSGVETN